MLVLIVALVFQWRSIARANIAQDSADPQVCDPVADYFLGMEDYPEAIRRHRIVIQAHPGNALAHYHLGFAYGVMGQHQRELSEYQTAIGLGLDDWQLFLNLGLLYLDNGQLRDATEVLRLATLLGPDHPEPHFNLGLAYERRGMLGPAEQQILLSLQIDPDQVEAHNTLGAIYAEEGKYLRASQEWTEIVQANPDYAPARANLDILERAERGEVRDTSVPGGLAGGR
ncbi:MAG TPA: tetratricopeptide repeat protein [Candidatus Binataceae bacterium]|nr:tetratricopeptide repeat protein [Candidatus Binataceae bacterium]